MTMLSSSSRNADINLFLNFTSGISYWLKAGMPVFKSSTLTKFDPVQPRYADLSVWGGEKPILVLNHRDKNGPKIVVLLGYLEQHETNLSDGRFAQYSPVKQKYAVDLELPHFDIDQTEPICDSLFGWLKNCTGLWHMRCLEEASFSSMMFPCVFTFEDENTALEFKLTFG